MADEDKPLEIPLAEIEAGKTPPVVDPAKSVEVKVEPAPETKEPEAGIEVLKAQLADLEKQAQAERTSREETEKVARDREAENVRYRAEAEQARVEITDTRYQVILNSIDAFKRDGEIAQRDYASALAAGDFAASAEAQRKIARSEAQLVSLENGKAALEDQARQHKEQSEARVQQPRQQTPNERFEGYVSRFTPRAQAYLRTHPEYALDDKLNRRLLRAHGEATDEQGLVPDTDAYFKFIDDRMQPNAQAIIVDTTNHQPVRRQAPAAPVSRQPVNSTPSATSVTLSPAEREFARISGMSDVEYARQMLSAQAEGLIVRH